jgi:decaprenylphospho-beta-D-erythro-pentofuranosid-2-ulose 2-reductase
VEQVLVVGATSAMAQSVARLLALEGASFYLIGRSDEKLQIVAQDLLTRGATEAFCCTLDFENFETYDNAVSNAIKALGGLTILIVAHGSLTDQARAQAEVPYLVDQIRVNLLSALAFITIGANWFEKRRIGRIVVFGSVAGDRGRQSNYVYGTAKSGLSTFTQGLRNRLASAGVQVLLVKPGFVDTPMTASLEKNILFASPTQIGRDVMSALRRNKRVLYTPSFWRYIMIAIRLIPEKLFVWMKL